MKKVLPIIAIVLFVGLVISAQNCSRYSPMDLVSSASSSASSSTATSSLANAAKSCNANGQMVPSGGSITMYFSASDTTCASEVRTCSNGTLSGTAANSSCTLPGGTSVQSFDFTALAAQNAGCGSTNLYGAGCASAFSRACTAAGYVTGFGPLEITATSAQAACLSPTMVSEVSVPWATIQSYQSGCSATNSSSDVCNSAVRRYCASNGFQSGLNITETSSANATVSCLKGPGMVAYQPTWAELYVSHHGCLVGDHTKCSTAVGRYCQSIGGGFNTGFGVQEYQSMSTAVVCLLPQAVSKPIDAMDTLSYFVPDASNVKSGDMPLTEYVDPGSSHVYMMKYNNPTFYEVYNWDSNYIYFAADDTNNSTQQFYYFNTSTESRTPWVPRSFATGASLDHDDNVVSHYQWSASTQQCANQGSATSFPFNMQLRAHIPRYNTQGSLGVVDVMVLSYTYYSNQAATPEPIYSQERFFFARTIPDANGQTKGLGWIRWENYGSINADSNGEGNLAGIVPTTVVDFSSLSTSSPVAPQTVYACGR